MFVSKILADRRSRIQQSPFLRCQYQLLRAPLERRVLSAAAEHIFVMPDLDRKSVV